MNVGLGLNVQFSLKEALEFLSRKVEHLGELFNVADQEAADKAKRVKDVSTSKIIGSRSTFSQSPPSTLSSL